MISCVLDLFTDFLWLLFIYLLFITCRGIYRNFLRQRMHLLQRYKNSNNQTWACVTGATSGIGFGFCQQLASMGFNILLVSRSQEKLKSIQSYLKEKNPQIQVDYIAADLSLYQKSLSPTGYFEEIANKIKQKDIGLFINNAGISARGLFLDINPEDIKQVIQTNTIPYAMLMKYLTHYFLDQKNSKRRFGVINVSSAATDLAFPTTCTYSGTKRFNEQWSIGIGLELQKRVDVLCLKPMYVGTKINNLKPDGRIVINSNQCASGTLDKLGYEEVTYGHWLHNFQAFILKGLIWILPEPIFNKLVIEFGKRRSRSHKKD